MLSASIQLPFLFPLRSILLPTVSFDGVVEMLGLEIKIPFLSALLFVDRHAGSPSLGLCSLLLGDLLPGLKS